MLETQAAAQQAMTVRHLRHFRRDGILSANQTALLHGESTL